MSLTPAYTLQNMADALASMRDAQSRFVQADEDYTNGVSGSGDRRALAIGDTSYYAAQAQTWAQATVALVAVMERYPESVRKAGVPR